MEDKSNPNSDLENSISKSVNMPNYQPVTNPLSVSMQNSESKHNTDLVGKAVSKILEKEGWTPIKDKI